MTSQIRGLNQAMRNTNDGISMLQTAKGATQEITNMLQRMRELAIQSANDTYQLLGRSSLKNEITSLSAEISRIFDNTEWNSMKLFTATNVSAGGIGLEGVVTLQVGVGGSGTTQFDVTLNDIDAE
jgi:flagellin